MAAAGMQMALDRMPAVERLPLVPPLTLAPVTAPATEATPPQWSRSTVLTLAQPDCSQCSGTGKLPLALSRRKTPCKCVLREVFRVCFGKFRRHTEGDVAFRGVLSPAMGWSRPQEEYCADFILIAKRTLSAAEWKLFVLHKLLGADWHLCIRRLGTDRGKFFHAVYRIEQKLGRAFHDTRPYPLYPPDTYNSRSITLDEQPWAKKNRQRRYDVRLGGFV